MALYSIRAWIQSKQNGMSSFNFENSFLHRKKGYINRLDIGKEEEEEEEVENH